MIFKTNKPPSHKVLRVTKVIPQQNYCFPWEGSDKVVIHGIIMIVSFAELSHYTMIMALYISFRPCHNPRGSPIFKKRSLCHREAK